MGGGVALGGELRMGAEALEVIIDRDAAPALLPVIAAIGASCALGAAPAQASSHREAPAITTILGRSGRARIAAT